MADWQPIPLGVKCYKPRAGAQSVERLLNLYAEPSEEGAKTRVTLYGTPGTKLWASDIGDGPIRGIYAFGHDAYVVSGGKLFYLPLATRKPVYLGAIGGVGPVRMIDNGRHVAITTSGPAYAANRSGVLSLPEANLGAVAYQDGYVIFAQRGTQTFWISGLDDLTTIGALDFSAADVFADNLVGCISDHRELYLFGEETIEGWQNTGDPSFPFARVPGAFMERGCAAEGTIAKALNRVLWLGNDLSVYAAAGFQPAPISTPAIDRLIAAASEPASAEAFVYAQGGHTFYNLSFSDLTLAYDLTTGLWHERESVATPGRWAPQFHALTPDRRHLCGTATNENTIVELDLDTYSDEAFDDELVREVVSPPISSGARGGFMAELFLDAEMGVGLEGGQGSDPTAMLDWSDDDGRTWGSEVTSSLGVMGRYRQKPTWSRLGMFTNRSLRFRISDPVKVAIMGAEWRGEVGQ